nr:unnamed protein product [Callosobruchus chinensis]
MKLVPMGMPNKYVRKTHRDRSDAEIYELVCEEVASRGESLTNAAFAYSITYRYTFKKKELYQANITDKPPSAGYISQTVFTNEEENILYEYLLVCAASNYGLPTRETRSLTYMRAKKHNKKFSTSWERNKMAGEVWLKLFMERHPNLSFRLPQATSIAHATSFNKTNKRIFVDGKSKKGKAKTLEKKNNTIDHEEKEYDYFCLCCLEPCSNNKSIEEWKRIFVDGKSKKGKAKTLEIRNNTIDHEEKEYDYFCLCCLEPFSNNKSIEEWKRIFVDGKSKKGKAKTLEKKNNTIDHEEKEYDYFCLCCLEPCSNNKSIEEWKRIFVDGKSKKGKAKTLEIRNNTIDHEEKEYDYFCLCCLEPFSNNKSIEEWKRIFVDGKSKKGKAKTLEKKNNTIDHEEKEYDYFCLCCLEPCSNNKSIEEWKRIFVDGKSKKGKAKTLEIRNNTIDHEEKEYDYFCLCCLEPFSNNKSIEEWKRIFVDEKSKKGKAKTLEKKNNTIDHEEKEYDYFCLCCLEPCSNNKSIEEWKRIFVDEKSKKGKAKTLEKKNNTIDHEEKEYDYFCLCCLEPCSNNKSIEEWKRIFVDEKSKKGKAKTLEKKNNTIDHEEKEYDYFCLCCLEPCSNNKSIEEWKRIFVDGKSKKGKAKTLEIRNNTIDHEEKEYDYFCLCCLEPFSNNKSIEEWKRIFVDGKSKKGKAKTLEKKNNTIDHEEKEYDYFCLCCLEPCSNNKSIEEWVTSIKKRIFVDEKSKKGKAKTLEKKNNTIDHEEKEYDYFCLCCLEPFSNNKSIEEWVTSIKKRIFVDEKSKKGKAKTLEKKNNTIDHEEKEYDYFCLCCLEPCSNNKSIEEWKRIFVDEKSKKGKAKTLEKKNNTIDHEEKEYDYFCLCCLEPFSNNKSIEEWNLLPEENEQAEDIPQPDSDEWDSSDDELLARLVPASSKRWIRKSQFQPFQNLDAIAYDYICEKDPFEYFQKYISQQFFEKVAMFTNMKEVSTTGHSLDTSTTEVRQLFGCSMLIGIYGLPRMRMYWAENTRVPLIADHITRNRFFKLRSRLKVVGCG